jgi:uncharacterized delta-60 repeat protein
VTHLPEQISNPPEIPTGTAIAIDPNGRAVVAGSTGFCGDTMVARFAPDGTLDADFGVAGVVVDNVDPDAGCGDSAAAVTLQPDGKILVATSSVTFENPPLAVSHTKWWLERFDPDGTLDPGFGNGGSVFLHDGAPASIALQRDGKVLTAGMFVTFDYQLPFVFEYPSMMLLRNEATTPIACDAAPRAGCALPLAAHKSSLTMSRRADTPPKLAWKWTMGNATTAAFGDPTSDDGSYAWCMYDATDALVAVAQVEGGGTCDGKPCWKASGSSGWQYKSSRGTVWGIDKLKLKVGVGSAQIRLQGKHWNLPRVPLPAMLPVRVQLQAPTGSCFEAVYSTATKNDGTRLVVKSDLPSP